MFASLHLQAEWSESVLWVEESGGYPLHPPAHTHTHTRSISKEERLFIELHELQAHRESEQSERTTPTKRMKLLNNVVALGFRFYITVQMSQEQRTRSDWGKLY